MTSSQAPTRNGLPSGTDSASGWSWAFEDPAVHWADHDSRQVEYWRSRPEAERLDQAAWYRERVFGTGDLPAIRSGTFLVPGEH